MIDAWVVLRTLLYLQDFSVHPPECNYCSPDNYENMVLVDIGAVKKKVDAQISFLCMGYPKHPVQLQIADIS